VQPGEAAQPGAKDGLVVLSVTRTGWRDFDLLLNVQGPSQWVARPIVLFAGSHERDWRGDATWKTTRTEAPEGRLVVLRLPPGTYRIPRWDGTSARDGIRGNGYWFWSEVDLGITFTVQPGRVVYAGNLNLALPDAPDFSGGMVAGTYTLVTQPRSERDLGLLRTRNPGIDVTGLQSVAMNFPRSGQPLTFYIQNAGDSGGPLMSP